MTQLESELVSFIGFAIKQLDEPKIRSVEDMMRTWRRQSEIAETVGYIREGMAEHAAGKTLPVNEAFAELRRRLGISA